MNIKIRFMVYNAYGIGGTVKTIFNFADYFVKTKKYDVEIISIKRTRDNPVLDLNANVKIKVIQDVRKNAKYSEEEKILLGKPSQLIFKEEDLYFMFNEYTDKKLKEVLSSFNDGVIVGTMPSFNKLLVQFVSANVLRIGQEHKSFADHTLGIQQFIRENYGKLDALTILTQRNKHIYERKIKGNVPVYVLGNGTQRLKFQANLKNHVIIAAGRYAQEKGYDMLIKAFAIIAQDFPDWIVKIYGEGQLAQEYISLIQQYGLQNRIILESGSDKMDEKLSEASIHVCSSYREGFGMVIIEGFAMGLPCVSFACDGPREIITDNYNGLIVEKENIEQLAKAMATLMEDEDYRLELGKNAYETAKKYDIAEIGKVFEDIINRELKNKKNKKDVPSEIVKKEVLLEKPQISLVENELNDYEKLVKFSSNGKIGISTIGKMTIGWGQYKVKNLLAKGSADKKEDNV